MTHTYFITGMTCNGCVGKVKSELLKIADITSADVQLTSPQATISMQRHIPTATLQEAVSKAGPYTITEAKPDEHDQHADAGEKPASYFPIFLIFGYITGATLLVQMEGRSFDLMQWMSHFMGVFFLSFSFFKLMDLRGFAEGFRTYDVVAKAWPTWGLIYPFVEAALGMAFITGFEPAVTNVVTLIVMSVSTIGVAQNILKGQRFQCACLGTVFKLPLSRVTLAEDLLMVAMSAAMLFLLR